MAEKIKLSEDEWRRRLTPEQFYVCRLQGTERPFTGKFDKCDIPGLYVCVCCGNPLFRSETKFDSHCGWPSFFEAIGPESVELREDRSHGMVRTEVVCARCESHLGHVFDDGPQPTGQRYCMNSISLALKRDPDEEKKK